MTSEGCVKNMTFSANSIFASLHWLLVVTLAGFTFYWILSVYWLIRSILFMSLSLSIQFTVHMCGHGDTGTAGDTLITLPVFCLGQGSNANK